MDTLDTGYYVFVGILILVVLACAIYAMNVTAALWVLIAGGILGRAFFRERELVREVRRLKGQEPEKKL